MKRATSSLTLKLALSFIAAGCGARGGDAPGTSASVEICASHDIKRVTIK